MLKWLRKQSVAFILGFLEGETKWRSTPDDMIEHINEVRKFLEIKYWR